MATREELLRDFKSERAKSRSFLTRQERKGIKTGANVFDPIRSAIGLDTDRASRRQIEDAIKLMSRERDKKYVPGNYGGSPITASSIKRLEALASKQAKKQQAERYALKDEKYKTVGWKESDANVWDVMQYDHFTVKATIPKQQITSQAKVDALTRRMESAIKNYDKNRQTYAEALRGNMERVLKAASQDKSAAIVGSLTWQQVEHMSKTTDFVESLFANHKSMSESGVVDNDFLEFLEDEYG